ncbi:DUF3857 domain-containing protein [uncultured Aquimarina sp.]|uniref:DUF3857 domain-containing protein n=1 Tax=uncultured Aquimarina sp. TaxID=575652 RepID=UPI00261CA856|nr:DUF3857 domain-containing protein [uncultured Aquimarina sp.]
MKKTSNLITIIIFIISFIHSIAVYGQLPKIDSLEEYIWSENDQYAELPTIPDKWKDESAIIILSDYDYYYFKGNKALNTFLITRKIIKLNDQASVNAFSEFDKLGQNKELIVKIIKPDGSVNVIDVDKEKVESSESDGTIPIAGGFIRKFAKKSKLAIPDLEIGDIIDFCIYYKEREPIIGVLEAPSIRDVISGEYPIMNYELDIHSKKDFFISIKTENGAPQPMDISPEKGKNKRYSFKMKDIEKIDPIMWEYTLLDAPYVKFQIALEKDKRTEAFVGEEKFKIKDNVTDEEVLNYYKGITVFDHGYKGSDKYLKDKDFSKKQRIEEAYYYMRQYYLNQFIEAAVAYQNDLTVDNPFQFYAFPKYITKELKFINYYASFLREEKIPFEMIAAIPRSQGKIDDLLFPDDITLFLKINLNPEKPLYVSQFGNHTNFNYIPYYLEGNEAYSLETGKGHRLETIKKVMIPVSDYKRNNSNQQYDITFVDGFEKIKVFRKSELKGHNKVREINDRLNSLNFTEEDHAKYNTKRLYDRLKKKRNKKKYEKEFPAFKEKIVSVQKESYQESLEEELDFKIEDFSFEVLETGRYNIGDVLSYKEEFLATNDLLKRAGPNYLFEIGKFIGGQIAIEEKDKGREEDIRMTYPRSFNNTINLTIPEGYEIAGLDKLDVEIKNETGGFTSNHTLEGNKLTINTFKYYTHNYEPNTNWSKMLEFLEAAYQFSQQKILIKKQ